MFIENKYTRWYYSIINNRKICDVTGYGEKHHIIPVSLGGTNEPENIIKLTAREHWICHQLLAKMVLGEDKMKMLHVCLLFKKTCTSSKRYNQLKKQRSEAMRGRKHSEETKLKIGLAHKGRKHTAEQIAKYSQKVRGKKLSVETREKMSIAHTGMRHLDETKLKIGQSNKGKNAGKIPTQEQRDKISKANKGKAKPTDFGAKIRAARSFTIKVQCPDGSIETVTFNKAQWAKDRNLRLTTLMSRIGEPYNGYTLLEIKKPN